MCVYIHVQILEEGWVCLYILAHALLGQALVFLQAFDLVSEVSLLLTYAEPGV